MGDDEETAVAALEGAVDGGAEACRCLICRLVAEDELVGAGEELSDEAVDAALDEAGAAALVLVEAVEGLERPAGVGAKGGAVSFAFGSLLAKTEPCP